MWSLVVDERLGEINESGYYIAEYRSKAVPLPAMEALGGDMRYSFYLFLTSGDK
jgi:hypothetical protein